MPAFSFWAQCLTQPPCSSNDEGAFERNKLLWETRVRTPAASAASECKKPLRLGLWGKPVVKYLQKNTAAIVKAALT